jgi:hypothetical protein
MPRGAISHRQYTTHDKADSVRGQIVIDSGQPLSVSTTDGDGEVLSSDLWRLIIMSSGGYFGCERKYDEIYIWIIDRSEVQVYIISEKKYYLLWKNHWNNSHMTMIMEYLFYINILILS